jgi:hypothetical protein
MITDMTLEEKIEVLAVQIENSYDIPVNSKGLRLMIKHFTYAINKNDLLGDVSNNEVFSEVAVCDCKAPAFRDEHGNHRCTECNELCNTD